MADISKVITPSGDEYNLKDATARAASATMTGATSQSAGTGGTVPLPAAGDQDKFLRADGTWADGGHPMVVLTYGTSTWQEFIDAYNGHYIVYCRVGGRMAFMAYVNKDGVNPTEVEFQYYRSVSSKSDTQQGDETYVYKLTNANGGTWTTQTRKNYTRVVAGTNLKSTYSSQQITLNLNIANEAAAAGGTTLSLVTTGEKASWNDKVGSSDIGVNVASLTNGVVPDSQIPDSVHDILEYSSSSSFPATGEEGKLYVDQSSNLTYRWDGTEYVQVGGSSVPVMTGATSEADGTTGTVPAPLIADRSKYLKGDGTWAYIPATPPPPDFMGATARMPGNSGLVPAPLTGDQDKYLKGDGTWSEVNAGGTITGITMNGVSKGTSGVVDLGTVITSHQDISGKVDGPLSATDGTVAIFDGTGGKTIKDSGFTIGKSVPSNAVFTDTTYSNKSASSEGTEVSLVTTGEKYNWNNKLTLDDVKYGWFEYKRWTGLTSFSGGCIWTDGDNIYYSDNSRQYVLDKLTSTWSVKTWSGLTSFYGDYIWTDGDNIYYSNGSKQYVLDKSTSTWSTKTWTGLTSFYGYNIWTDGDNIYYSYGGSSQYVLDKSTSTWSAKTWTGLTSFSGSDVWTDGDNIYYSNLSKQYVLDKSTSTWSAKTWSGLTSFYGNYIWTDGDNIYYSYGNQHVLDKATSTWSAIKWYGSVSINGNDIWIDGNNIYYSHNTDHYFLNKVSLGNSDAFRNDVFDLDTVVNESGSYTHTSSVPGITADMKPIKLDLGNPSVFMDRIRVETGDGTVTLSCNSVVGTSTARLTVAFIGGSNALTSAEFGALTTRINEVDAKVDAGPVSNQSGLYFPIDGLNTTNWSDGESANNGGYERIGDIVFINIKIQSKVAIAAGASTVFTDGSFPIPKGGLWGTGSKVAALSDVRPGTTPFISATGALQMNTQCVAIPQNEGHFITGVYLAEHEEGS